MSDILIVIDMQQGFMNNNTKEVADNITELLELDIFDKVVATKFSNNINSPFVNILNYHSMIEDRERKLLDIVEDKSNYIRNKTTYNCVDNSFVNKLYELNNNKFPERVFLTGVDTDCSVLAISTGLFERNIIPIVLSRYCGSNGGYISHDSGLVCLSRLIGSECIKNIRITSKQDLVNL